MCPKYVAFPLYSNYYISLLPTILFRYFNPTAEGESKAFLSENEIQNVIMPSSISEQSKAYHVYFADYRWTEVFLKDFTDRGRKE